MRARARSAALRRERRDLGHDPAAMRRLPEIEPQLATLVRDVPEGAGWSYEIKYDGYRAIAYVASGTVRLVSRNGLSFAERFGSICRALGGLGVESAILDGEVCAIDEAGRTRFEALHEGASELVYFVFDLLWLDGDDLRALPLEERRRRLERLLPRSDRGTVRRSERILGGGHAFLEAARELGLEGLIAKRGDRPYRGGRSTDWVKVKVDRREELVIVGATPPRGSRQRFGALLLGIPDDATGALRFAGKVGTGFDTATLEDLHERMLPLRIDRPPVIDPPRIRGAVWVRPELVAEIRYTEWTADGKLRHPAFLGLREDKAAADVRRERPAKTAARRRR